MLSKRKKILSALSTIPIRKPIRGTGIKIPMYKRMLHRLQTALAQIKVRDLPIQTYINKTCKKRLE